MTKAQIKKQVRSLKKKVEDILKSEDNLVYNGTDDNFGDAVSHVYGDLGSVLDSIDAVIEG